MNSQRLYFLFIIILASIMGSTAYAESDNASVNISWGYKGNTGPEFWGRLNPKFILCGEGKSQSPIDITQDQVAAPNALSLHYQESPLFIVDDGTTELMIGKQKTVFNDGHTVQVNFKDKKVKETIHYAGNDYELVEFHFHSPSENQLQGRSHPLEIHFVHQGKEGRVVVIGVFVDGGSENPTLQEIIDHLPKADGKEVLVPNEKINPADLFPDKKDYYSFDGSLTTPPCTEGLQWIVMQATITASPAQIAILRKAIGGSNARSVQPLNGRVVAYSAEGSN